VAMRGFLVAGLGAGVLLLSACGWEVSRDGFSDDTNIDTKITSVQVNGDSGHVTIRTGDKAKVHRDVAYRRDRPGASHHVEREVLVIDPCKVRNCFIDYDITVPAGTRVNGRVDSGTVDVSGVAEINFQLDSGNLTAKGVAGRVNVESSSGSVRLTDVGADVVVRADSGDVTVDNAGGSVTVRGDSGNIAVSVPRGPYRVSTGTDSGTVHSDVSDDPSGSHRLELHTSAGNITVKYV
jgi:hypothetical protein